MPGPYHTCPLSTLQSLPGAGLRGLSYDGANGTLWAVWAACGHGNVSQPLAPCDDPVPIVMEHTLTGETIRGLFLLGMDEPNNIGGATR